MRYDLSRLCDRTPPQTIAGLDALNPGMIEVCVAEIPALLEPGTATSATTECAGFLHDAALGAPLAACLGCSCCRGYFYGAWVRGR